MKKHLFPGPLNNSVSWPKVWSGWDAHFASCSGALPGSPTHCKTPALRRFADHVFHFWLSKGMRYHHKQGSTDAKGQEKMLPKRKKDNVERGVKSGHSHKILLTRS